MSAVAAPPPIPGDVIDPPPKETPDKVKELDARDDAAGAAVGVAYRAWNRFSYSKASLLAAGTSYYLFLAMFSVLAFAYGVVSVLGADQVAELLTEALSEAFPGMLGDEGIDPETLQRIGRATSIVGLVLLLYAGTGAMAAISASLHQVFGAPPDPRGFVPAKARLLLWMVILGPLLLLSFVATTVLFNFGRDILDAVGIEGSFARVMLTVVGTVLALALNYLAIWLVLGNLGGIRPAARPRRIGAGVGAILVEILKYFMALLVGFTVAKPQYGAFAIPIGVLFVFYLQTTALYGSAALTAGIAEKDVPLDELTADAAETEQPA